MRRRRQKLLTHRFYSSLGRTRLQRVRPHWPPGTFAAFAQAIPLLGIPWQVTLPSHYLVEFAPSLKALPQTNLLEEPPGLPILSSLSSSVPVSRHTQHLVPELLTLHVFPSLGWLSLEDISVSLREREQSPAPSRWTGVLTCVLPQTAQLSHRRTSEPPSSPWNRLLRPPGPAFSASSGPCPP